MINGELTETELGYLRRDGQKSLIYLAFLDTPAVFKARINQSFSTTDKISEIIYDGVSLGDYSDILPGMTCWVGSSAGAYDLGQVRVRKAATSNTLYIGETSEIDWANNLYLTVVDDFGLWARSIATDRKNVVSMDKDIAFRTDYMVPFPVVGSDRVVRLTGSTVVVEFDGSESFCVEDTIVSHAFVAPGASATSGMSTATPTITYNAIGTYRVAYTVVATSGATTTTYRKVFVWDDAHTPYTFDPADMVASDFILTAMPHGSHERGGWAFGVQMYNQAAISAVRDRQKVVLFSRDFYGDDEISIGPLPGSENIITIGWIDGESIDPDPRSGRVTFDVQGPHHWLANISGPPLSLINSFETATEWSRIESMTVDKALAHYLAWRTTVLQCMDCTLTTDNLRFALIFDAAIGSVWQQLQMIAARVLASVRCDRYGRMFIQLDSQYLYDTSRSSIPVVMDIEKTDRRSVSIARRTSPTVSSMQIACKIFIPDEVADLGDFAPGSGINFTTTVYSMSPGHVARRFGSIEQSRGDLLANSQLQSNQMCGLLIAQHNNAYPDIAVELGSNNRAIDICPRQYVTADVGADDTPRGIAFSGRIVPRDVSYEIKRGVLLTTINGEAETFAALAINGDIPLSPPLNSTPPTPVPNFPLPPLPPPMPPPGTPPLPPIPIPTWPVVPSVYILTYGYGIYYTETFGSDSPTWLAKNTGGPSDTGSLLFMEIDRIGGILYVAGHHGAWYGPLGDALLLQFIDQDWLDTEFPLGGVLPQSGNNRIGAFGVNSTIANSLVISAGSGYLGTHDANFYSGSYAGMTRKTEIDWRFNDGDGNLTFYPGDGDNTWLATGLGFLGANYWAKSPKLLTSITAGGFSSEVSPNVGGEHIRAGTSEIIYIYHSGFNLVFSDDNLETATVRDFVAYCAPACSPDGQYLMSASHDDLCRSSDFGETWEVVATWPGGIPQAIVCIDADHWIAINFSGAYSAIRYTTDFGASAWTDKTGDFTTVVPSGGSSRVRKIIVL